MGKGEKKILPRLGKKAGDVFCCLLAWMRSHPHVSTNAGYPALP